MSANIWSILPDFRRNDGNEAGHKDVISADIDNIGQGYRLQKSLHLGYYITDFNQTFTEIMQL